MNRQQFQMLLFSFIDFEKSVCVLICLDVPTESFSSAVIKNHNHHRDIKSSRKSKKREAKDQVNRGKIRGHVE